MKGTLQLASGRVIALGRLLLTTLFLTAMWIPPQPVQVPIEAYWLMTAYVLTALGLTVCAWTSWWLDAHLAGAAHALDIAMFTLVVFLTQGDTSPYFIFCIFVLLAAAIRWGWRATALTAILLTLLYLLAGFVSAAGNDGFEVDRFVMRTGYLVILSMILIWFGVNQWHVQTPQPVQRLLANPALDAAPLENSLRAAMADAGALGGAFLWSKKGRASTVLVIRNGELAVLKPEPSRTAPPALAPFLYDLPNDRAMTRDGNGDLQFFPPADHIDPRTSAMLHLRAGLAIPIVGEAAEGQLYLEDIRGLSPDHLEFGKQLGTAVARHMQRRALIKAAEESAEARSRLAIARDLHDSVVQFLAGAAFRLEAIKRSAGLGRDLVPELDELKQLLLQEQSELRSFITALRTGSQMELAELARDLQSLANRLSRQWDVQCSFSVEPSDMAVPTRMHLDAHQLVREAVANAVRHAGAKNVSIRLSGLTDELRLDFINDGAAYPKTFGGSRMPLTLKERAEASGGAVELSRGMGVTKISISLPITGKAA